MAKNGVQGPKSIIEGTKGFAKALSDKCDYDIMLIKLNEAFHINDCYIKLYPSCRHTHSPVDAALDLVKENDFGCLDIKNILIKTYPTAISFAGKYTSPKPLKKQNSAYHIACAPLW